MARYLMEKENNKSIIDVNLTEPEEELTYKDILKKCEPKSTKGQYIGKLCCSCYYVEEFQRVEHLAQAFSKNPDIPAVGVVNKDNELTGIIIRQELFDLLSRPYGRDLYYYKRISMLTRETDRFYYDMNIYSVANKLSNSLRGKETATEHYLLVNNKGEFSGIFSSIDLLKYLSEITQQDMKFAKDIQFRIIREKEFVNDKCEIYGTSKMAKGVGGDFYAIKKYSDANWVVLICDVSGKGMPAALVTAVIGGMFGIHDLKKGFKPFLVALNKYLYETFQLQKYATGIFIDYNEQTGEITLFDFGHGHLYLLRENRLVKLKIKNGNMPLGITEDITPNANKLQLRKNDLLVSFTDGIDEQTNTDGEEYDIMKLINIITKNKNKLSLKEISDEILKDIKEFRDTLPQHDDMTMILLKQK